MTAVAAQRRLLQAWRRRGWLAWLLWPLSLIYRILWSIRKTLYRVGLLPTGRLPIPVVVVGNVVAGGAGKTPIVMALVQHLQAQGLRPGVVSRGYGRTNRECRMVTPDSSPDEVGDEPLLIRRRTAAPVCVAASRLQAARALLVQHPELDLLICDDGLQHLGLHRDIEICVFDERDIGNGFLLPAGPLREPWPRVCDLVVAAGNPVSPRLGFVVHRVLADHALRSDGSRMDLHALAAGNAGLAKPITAVAGTARPEIFFRMLRDAGLTLSRTVALKDHSTFDAARWKQAGDDIVLCTEKDAAKLWRHRPDAWAVPLLVSLDHAFWRAFEQLLLARAPPALRSKLSSNHGHPPT